MAVKIRHIVLKDAASYRQCFDAVAKERRYFPVYQAPPPSVVRAYLRKSLRDKTVFLIAEDQERVVGWAAVSSSGWPSSAGCGHFGIGLLPEYRGMGLGTKLAARVLKMARGKFSSVFLFVLRKNKPARKLIKKMGFELCGEIKKGVKLPQGFDDNLIMQKRMRTA
jgi:ribosomal protein S18 acetylase RimI-like enzyme